MNRHQLALVFAVRRAAGDDDSTPAFSLTAPVLAFVSATDPDSDNTQDLNADFFESIVGKVVRLVGTFGSATVITFNVDSSNTIDAGEDAALAAAFTTGVIPDGLCAFKCRIEDGSGNTLSDWSNTVSKTIGTYDYFAPRYFPNRYFAERYFG